MSEHFEQQLVYALIPVAEPKLALFKMQAKEMRTRSPVVDKADFDISPESFDTIDVCLIFNELGLAMIHSQVLSVTNIDEAICSLVLEQLGTISM